MPAQIGRRVRGFIVRRPGGGCRGAVLLVKLCGGDGGAVHDGHDVRHELPPIVIQQMWSPRSSSP